MRRAGRFGDVGANAAGDDTHFTAGEGQQDRIVGGDHDRRVGG